MQICSPDSRDRSQASIIVAMIVLLMSVGPAGARQLPVSLTGSVEAAAVERIVMPEVNVAALEAEDEIRDSAFTPGPVRFAAPIAAAYSTENSGIWQQLNDGSRLWRLQIHSPRALSLNLGLKTFDLPQGARLWVYDTAGEQIAGPYSRRDRNRRGQLWLPIILGDEVVLELHLPVDSVAARVEVGWVNHGYRFFGEAEAKQGSCNIDVVCPEVDPYRDLVHAVARYTISGFTLCTGQLVNNTAGDFRPLFLTAQHCGINPANASTLVVYWNYESPTCGQLSGGSLADNQGGATYLAGDFSTDFTLVELDRMPDSQSNVYYAGWDAGGATPQSTVVIHHPSGDEKAAAFEGDPLVDADIGRGGTTHWEVTAYDLGTTEPGSSGSCIFDQTNQGCVGWLTGGTAACTVPDGFDVFGKLSLAWTGGGTDDMRLSNWLDPVGGGTTTFIEGADPDGTGDDDGNGGCVPDATTLCLDGRRFEVTVGWRDFAGATGSGVVSPGGEDYWGVFWFFSPMNAEVLVKVLDGCDFNDHFWVFAAAATDVEYSLTVTDTSTGISQTYGNELGTAAPAVVDTSAFATCP